MLDRVTLVVCRTPQFPIKMIVRKAKKTASIIGNVYPLLYFAKRNAQIDIPSVFTRLFSN